VQPMEVYVDDEAKLTLNGLQQHYVKLKENEKNKKLFELLDVLEFNQVCLQTRTIYSGYAFSFTENLYMMMQHFSYVLMMTILSLPTNSDEDSSEYSLLKEWFTLISFNKSLRSYIRYWIRISSWDTPMALSIRFTF